MQQLLRLWRTLEAAPVAEAVVAEWDAHFGDDAELLRPHLTPTGTRAGTYPCPHGGGDGCPRQVLERDDGTLEAVCGNVPAECPPLRLKKPQLAVLRLDRSALLSGSVASLQARELLRAAPGGLANGLLPLGLLERAQGTLLVVLGTPESAGLHGALLELKRLARADVVAVLVDDERPERRTADGIVELPIGKDSTQLRLWRAVRLAWPESWAERATANEALLEEVQLEFASEPERHVVRLNGVEVAAFRVSDAKFARLLLLAATRAAAVDVVAGGWLKKAPALQLDEKEKDLADVRKGFYEDLTDDFAGLPELERKALIQTSPAHPGMVRLALHPRHLRFDDSLSGLRLLGEKQAAPKTPSKRATSGAAELAHNQAQSRAKTLKMLAAARKLGVALPSEVDLKSS